MNSNTDEPHGWLNYQLLRQYHFIQQLPDEQLQILAEEVNSTRLQIDSEKGTSNVQTEFMESEDTETETPSPTNRSVSPPSPESVIVSNNFNVENGISPYVDPVEEVYRVFVSFNNRTMEKAITPKPLQSSPLVTNSTAPDKKSQESLPVPDNSLNKDISDNQENAIPPSPEMINSADAAADPISLDKDASNSQEVINMKQMEVTSTQQVQSTSESASVPVNADKRQSPPPDGSLSKSIKLEKDDNENSQGSTAERINVLNSSGIKTIEIVSTSSSDSTSSSSTSTLKEMTKDTTSVSSLKSTNPISPIVVDSPQTQELSKDTPAVALSHLQTRAKKLLASDVVVELPLAPTQENFSAEAPNYTLKKIVWWILKNAQDPKANCLIHPELHDDDELRNAKTNNFSEYDELDKAKACDSDEGLPIALRAKQYMKEFFGPAILEASLRNPCQSESEEFFKIFHTDTGTNYDKESFSGKCALCKEVVVGKVNFETHLNSSLHKDNLKKLSLDLGLAQYKEILDSTPPIIEYVAKIKVYTGKEEPADSLKALLENSKPSNVEKKTNLPVPADYMISEDHVQIGAKLKLRNAGKWTNKLNINWSKMIEEEKMLKLKFEDEKTKYWESPSSHPDHENEWEKFWTRRRQEIKKEGKNPNKHDFKTEWSIFWRKRLLELLKSEAERKIHRIKMKFGMDTTSLSKLLERPHESQPSVRSSVSAHTSRNVSQPYRRSNHQNNGYRGGQRAEPYSFSPSYRYPQYQFQHPVNYNLYNNSYPISGYNLTNENPNTNHFYNQDQSYYQYQDYYGSSWNTQ